MHHHEPLNRLIASVPPADNRAARAAQQRLDSLTKPKGSLGQIESLIVRLAASIGNPCPLLSRRLIVLAAADHGVADEGVSGFPQAVTAQMVQNFLAGGAAINALAASTNARIAIVDAGVVAEIPDHPDLHRLSIRAGGSGNIAREPAMQPDEAAHAVLAGASLVEEEATKKGIDILLVGEMGIANTTPAAALTSALTGISSEESVGRGTGISDEMLLHKRAVVEQALRRALPKTTSPPCSSSPSIDAFAVLCELGGLEIAVLVGAMLAASVRRIPTLLDGYITTSAALVAVSMAPNLQAHLFASHCSVEPGHAIVLKQLGLKHEAGAGPLLQLDMRLGEGSGAAFALPILVSATNLMKRMATFAEAGVSNQ